MISLEQMLQCCTLLDSFPPSPCLYCHTICPFLSNMKGFKVCIVGVVPTAQLPSADHKKARIYCIGMLGM
jgi:hypothetical protein